MHTSWNDFMLLLQNLFGEQIIERDFFYKDRLISYHQISFWREELKDQYTTSPQTQSNRKEAITKTLFNNTEDF